MTSKNLTRKQFLKLGVGIVGVGAVMGSMGCPGDDGTSDDGPDPGSTGNNPGSTGTETGSTGNNGSSGEPPPETTSGDPPETTTGPADSSGDPPTTGVAGCEADPDVVIGTNHGHELVVTLAEVEAGVETTYEIQGTSPHMHSVTLTAEHFAMLAAGMTVMVTSTEGGAHTHEVTVSCG